MVVLAASSWMTDMQRALLTLFSFQFQHFGVNISDLGLELQEAKSECYCPAGVEAMAEHRPLTFPLGNSNGETVGYGVRIGGIPMGDAVFVEDCLACKAAKVVSKVNKVNDALQPLHLQTLFCSTLLRLEFIVSPLDSALLPCRCVAPFGSG